MQSEETHGGRPDEDAVPGTIANEEKLRSGVVFGWGIAMFVAVLVAIGALSGYFWSKRDARMETQVGERSTFGATAAELQKAVDGRLKGYKRLGDGRYQIPIDEAMKKIAQEGL